MGAPSTSLTSIVFVVVLLLMTGCNRQNLRIASRAVLYSAYSSSGTPASSVYCGNGRKVPSGGGCSSKAQHPDGSPRPATEKVEVRGWIVGIGGFADADNDQGQPEEFTFDVLLDHGWTPGTPADANIRPVNTVQEVNAAITPHNAIAFGLGWQGVGSTRLDTEGRVWGGHGAPVIHVEVNGWFPAGTPVGTRMHGHPVPSDWAGKPNGVFWPFDPESPPSTVGSGPLRLGDYVRLVGTLWEDEAHKTDGGAGGDKGKDAKGCWCSGATGGCTAGGWGRGYFEIHPVDYLARIDPPTAASATLEVVAMCDSSSVVHEIQPPLPRPPGQVTVAFEELVDPEFTLFRSVAQDTVTVLSDRIRLDARVETGGLFGHGAKFKATYRVFWRAPDGTPVASGVYMPRPRGLRLLEDPPTEDNCSASIVWIDHPRESIERGHSLTLNVTNPQIDWFCGSPTSLPLSNQRETTRCPAGTTVVRVTRATTGDEFTTDCYGP